MTPLRVEMLRLSAVPTASLLPRRPPAITETTARSGRATGLDHRQARRLPVDLPVIMQFSQGQRSYGQARNLSQDGVFIETGVRLNFDCCLDLIVATGDAVGLDPIVLPALVVHRSSHGLGLMFRPLDGTASASVRRLLDEAQSRPAHSS
ncbi:MAG TPA: PilZ domain-containing protein [Lamprocystis sp. (in: g-proteobacteria)]|nr:PilZ domain-containing protein [Lamprocystis sp. (in: g-proteobacteria)]